MQETLIVLIIVALLSLLAAIVLFKVLKSTALIKKAGYQAGGALAGFIIIYSTLYYSYDSLSDKIHRETVEKDYIKKSELQLSITAMAGIKDVKVNIYEGDKEIAGGITDSEGVFTYIIPDAWKRKFIVKFEKEGYDEVTMAAEPGSRIISARLKQRGEL